MTNIQFLSAENEIQKLYSNLGLVVPVGDLSAGKAPSVKPLSTSSTQTSVTASFNVMTGADLTAMSYTVNDGEAQSITPSKGVVTVTLTDLEYNSGPYSIKLTATNETGSTNVTTTVALQHYTNWATPDKVLEGNKYIGEDGEQHVGEIETKDSTDLTISGLDVTIPAGYYAESITATSEGVIPSGTLAITQNGEGIDVTDYQYVDVSVSGGGGTPPDPVCITARQNGTTVGISGAEKYNIKYSTDGENWNDWEFGTTTVNLSQGNVLYLRGNNPVGLAEELSGVRFNISGQINLSGNAMSLINKDDSLDYVPAFAFCRLFEEIPVVEVSADFLPATTLAYGCYALMFNRCTAMTQPPELPATTMATACYNSMFSGCTSLGNAPSVLPATTLYYVCYNGMFSGCTSLVNAPSVLPATTLAYGCYAQMFSGCTSLVNVPSVLPATTLAQDCYSQMFSRCSSLTHSPSLVATTTLAQDCYTQMFKGCTSLRRVDLYASDSSLTQDYPHWGDNCMFPYTANWLEGVSATGDFYNLGNASIPQNTAGTCGEGESGIPAGWTMHTSL